MSTGPYDQPNNEAQPRPASRLASEQFDLNELLGSQARRRIFTLSKQNIIHDRAGFPVCGLSLEELAEFVTKEVQPEPGLVYSPAYLAGRITANNGVMSIRCNARYVLLITEDF